MLGLFATAPIAVPGIVLGVGLFLSYTRPPFVLYGTLWILLIAFLTINLPSAYQQLGGVRDHPPELRKPAVLSARAGCSRCGGSPRRRCPA